MKLADVIAADPRLRQRTPLSKDDYSALASRLAAVDGVEAAMFAGDGLGSITTKISGGGIFEWRHLDEDEHEVLDFPTGFDFAQLTDPVENVDFGPPDLLPPPPVKGAGTYATRFNDTSSTGQTNVNFVADEPVAATCPKEGRIAIVDFSYEERQRTLELYTDPASPFVIDGEDMWTRIQRMGAAAGFEVDVYTNNDITAGNFVSKLSGYTYVITTGHGTRPGLVHFDRTGEATVSLNTTEDFDSNFDKKLEDGTTYFEAWKKGWLYEGLTDHTVRWTPRLIQALYAPAGPQMWYMNQCNMMLPAYWGFEKDDQGQWVFRKAAVGPIYNFGRALREKGVKAVVGYVAGANLIVIPHFLMAFLRRQFGGYFSGDLPPWPHHFWPTCMSVQTFFRNPSAPASPTLSNKLEGGSLLTLYKDSAPLFLRKVCQGSPTIPHAYLQDFVLLAGTPATQFGLCWDTYWSGGRTPTPEEDPICNAGDFPTSEEGCRNAGCTVMQARRVTDAMLPPR